MHAVDLDALFDSFVALRFDPRALAHRLSLSPSALLALITTDAFRERLSAWSDLESLSTSLRAASLRAHALDTLERTMRESPDPVEVRRAASAILRSSSPRSPRNTPTTPRPHPQAHAHPASPQAPSPPANHDPAPAPPHTTRVAVDGSTNPPDSAPIETQPPPEAPPPAPPATPLTDDWSARLSELLEQTCKALNIPIDSLDQPVDSG